MEERRTREGTRKGGRDREESRGDVGCRTKDEGGWTSEGYKKRRGRDDESGRRTAG
jgi:hypothetical protein